jgi:hypothetical protein
MKIEKAMTYANISYVMEVFYLTNRSTSFVHKLHSKYYDERKYSNRFDERSTKLWEIIGEIWDFHFNEELDCEEAGFLKYEFLFLNEINESFHTKEPVLLEYIDDEIKECDFYKILIEEGLVSFDKENLYLSDPLIKLMNEIKQKYM